MRYAPSRLHVIDVYVGVRTSEPSAKHVVPSPFVIIYGTHAWIVSTSLYRSHTHTYTTHTHTQGTAQTNKQHTHTHTRTHAHARTDMLLVAPATLVHSRCPPAPTAVGLCRKGTALSLTHTRTHAHTAGHMTHKHHWGKVPRNRPTDDEPGPGVGVSWQTLNAYVKE